MLGEFGAHLTRDLWRVFGHSNYPHLAYRQYRHTSSSRQICDILNSTDLFLQASLIILTKGANNSDHDCKVDLLCEISHARLIRI